MRPYVLELQYVGTARILQHHACHALYIHTYPNSSKTEQLTVMLGVLRPTRANRRKLPQAHRLVVCAFIPPLALLVSLSKKNHPSLSLPPPPPLSPCSCLVLDVDTHSPCCYRAPHPPPLTHAPSRAGARGAGSACCTRRPPQLTQARCWRRWCSRATTRRRLPPPTTGIDRHMLSPSPMLQIYVSGVSEVCCRCFYGCCKSRSEMLLHMLHMLQVFQTHVARVYSKCFICSEHMLQAF